MPCSAPSPKPDDGLTTFGKAELHRSRTSQSKKARVNGTYACWLPSPSYRPGSSRRSLKVLPLQMSLSLVLPGLCRTPGPSRTTASACSNCSLAAIDAEAWAQCSRGTLDAQLLCPVSVPVEPVSGIAKRKLENNALRLGATRSSTSPASSLNWLQETGPGQPNPLKCRHFCRTPIGSTTTCRCCCSAIGRPPADRTSTQPLRSRTAGGSGRRLCR